MEINLNSNLEWYAIKKQARFLFVTSVIEEIKYKESKMRPGKGKILQHI